MQRKMNEDGYWFPPEDFSEEQAACWDDAYDILVRAQDYEYPAQVPRSEIDLLDTYAINYVRWREAEKYLRENGETVVCRNSKGEVEKVIEAPQVKIAEKSERRVNEISGLLFRSV